jgi:hypothetical protein
MGDHLISVCTDTQFALCTKCTLHSNHRLTRVIFQHTKWLLSGAAIFSLHTLASPSGRNVNYDEEQLTGGGLNSSFCVYRFRKYVSYGFPLVNFFNPGVHYETPCIKYIYFVTNYFLHVSAFVTPPSGRISHYLLENYMIFYHVVTWVMYLVCNVLCAFRWNMEEATDYKNVRNRKLQNKATLLVCIFWFLRFHIADRKLRRFWTEIIMLLTAKCDRQYGGFFDCYSDTYGSHSVTEMIFCGPVGL